MRPALAIIGVEGYLSSDFPPGSCNRPEATQTRTAFSRGVAMNAGLLIVLAYLFAMLAIGLVFQRISSKDAEEFFLAGRRVPRMLLFATMAATNFSAFTIFGLSGAGYRVGYAFYPVMGFGTGFMALSFLVIGIRINALSRRRRWITPAAFVAERYGSPALARLFSLVMIAFTLPYVALQSMAAGSSLQALTGLPYIGGAALVAGFSVLYVTLGGMRSDIWTDVVQGVMMIGLTLAAFVLVAVKSGGFVRVHEEIFASFPDLFSRPGQDGSMVYGVWLGYLLLWFFADPMFPQLFQRFMAAKDEGTVRLAAVLYPLVTTFLFFLTVSIGVMGRHAFPSLSAAESDTILARLLEHYVGGPLGALLLTGGMAALMSTLDSQLLSLGSMITRDFRRPGVGRRGARHPSLLCERLVIVSVGILGFLIALRPPATLLGFLNRASFPGFAALAPCVLGGLYWKRATKQAAAASIIAGEAAVLASALGLVPLPGVHPAIPAIAASAVAFVVGSMFSKHQPASQPEAAAVALRAPPRAGSLAWALLFLAFFILANDFWAWGRRPVLILGLPLWVWYFITLGILLALAYAMWSRKNPVTERAEQIRGSSAPGD